MVVDRGRREGRNKSEQLVIITFRACPEANNAEAGDQPESGRGQRNAME